jgi:hypothetical protein
MTGLIYFLEIIYLLEIVVSINGVQVAIGDFG